MVEQLDESFDAVLMIGYHSAGGTGGSPLAHTVFPHLVDTIKINDVLASEFLLHAYAAGMLKVPVVFVSGDEELTQQVTSLNAAIRVVGVKKGVGDSVISIHPQLAVRQIREQVEAGLKGDLAASQIALSESFRVEVRYQKHARAYRAGFYPGVEQVSPREIAFETSDWFEVMRAFTFIL